MKLIRPKKVKFLLLWPITKDKFLRNGLKKGPVEISEAINITIQVLQDLSKAHNVGIVHRDIKSANTIITDDGEVKIIDFGLAKLTWQSDLTKNRSCLKLLLLFFICNLNV